MHWSNLVPARMTTQVCILTQQSQITHHSLQYCNYHLLEKYSDNCQTKMHVKVASECSVSLIRYTDASFTTRAIF